MGQIGRFIDKVCAEHPPLMRAVLERPLAPLEKWLHFDGSGSICGCLIGTVALAAGLKPERYTLCVTVFESAATATGVSTDDIADIGYEVAAISRRLAGDRFNIRSTPASDARTVHLLRQRIARQLAVRESALGVDHPSLPNEPVEPVVNQPAARVRGAGR